MAAYLSMASFLAIGIPSSLNRPTAIDSLASSSASLSHSDTHTNTFSESESSDNRVTPLHPPRTSTSVRGSDLDSGSTEPRIEGTGEEGSESFGAMSIFASQPIQAAISVPPPSYGSSRNQPPPYLPSSSRPRTPSSSSTAPAPPSSTSSYVPRSWFGSMFGSRITPPSNSPASPVRGLTPLSTRSKTTTNPPTSLSSPSLHPSASASSLSVNTVSTISTFSTITTQPSPREEILPRYEAIQTPKPSLTTTTTTSSSSSSTNSTRKIPISNRPTWRSPYMEADVDPYEEYEMRQRAERERSENPDGGDWCCGCFWVGPAHPWQAYYIY